MNVWCKLGIHEYKRIGEPVPTKAAGEFNCYVNIGFHALGKCKNCPKLDMRPVNGSFSYYPHDMKTKNEWLSELTAQEVE